MAVLENPESFEVLALSPSPRPSPGAITEWDAELQAYVLGRVRLTRAEGDRVVEALYRGLDVPPLVRFGGRVET